MGKIVTGGLLALLHMACRVMNGPLPHTHYSDVTMGAMASQITSLTIVYSTVYSGADQRKHPQIKEKFRVTGLCAWNSPVTSEFPVEMASNTENVFI